MKTSSLSIIFTTLIMLIGAPLFAQDFNYDGILYTVTSPNNLTVKVAGYKNNSPIINIPQSITSGNKTYKVTSIGDRAFSFCETLVEITVGENVTSIGYAAFFNCENLTSIHIPGSVNSIDESAFSGCYGLNSITIASDNQHYDSRNNCNAIIKTSTNTLMVGSNNSVIPDGVTKIADYAFSRRTNLTGIKIPNSVTHIGNGAFDECSNLTEIIFPDHLVSIGDYAFNICANITSINIPNTVTSIGDYAFCGCRRLNSITVASDNQYYDSRNNCNAIIETVSNTLMCGCKNTVIPNGVTKIANNAFQECTGLTSINIPSSVTNIGSEAFCFCFGLTNVNIPEGVPSIKNGTFWGCEKLSSITIPNSITIIGDHAFADCLALSNITIPNSVKSIGNDAFLICISLTNVTIGSSVTSIGFRAFESCPLKEIEILAETPPIIDDDTFDNLIYNWTSLLVPAGCKQKYLNKSYWHLFKNINESSTGFESIQLHHNADATAFDLKGNIIHTPIPDQIFIQEGRKKIRINK